MLRVAAGGRKGVEVRFAPARKRRRRAAAAARPGFVDVAHPAIWVQHFDVSGAAEELSVLRRGLAHMLITDLAGIDCERGPVVVVRERLDVIREEIRRQQGADFDPRTRLRPGRIVEHNATVGGTVTSSGDTITLTATYTDLRSGRTATASASGARSDFFEVQQELARELEEIVCAPDPVRVRFSSTGSLVWSMREVRHPDPATPQWTNVFDERVDLSWRNVDTMSPYTVARDAQREFVTHGLTGLGGSATEDGHTEDWDHHRDRAPTREMVADEHCSGVVSPWQQPFVASMQNRAVVTVLRAGSDAVEVRWRPAMYGFIGGVRG